MSPSVAHCPDAFWHQSLIRWALPSSASIHQTGKLYANRDTLYTSRSPGARHYLFGKNARAGTLGVWDGALGLANCKATIEFSGSGYLGLLGWVQLVRSTDNAFHGRQFEIDPFDPFGLYERAPMPYCWYGITPTLFDAPSREERVHLDWVAHSFLAASPFGGNTRIVMPLLGFSWGFQITDHKNIELKPVTVLTIADWEEHLPYLRDCYKEWEFTEIVPMPFGINP